MSVVGFRRENTQTNVDYWGDRCCKAEAEIERLRAALDEIEGQAVAAPLAKDANELELMLTNCARIASHALEPDIVNQQET